MSGADTDLNEHGNHQGEFSQGVGGWAEYTVYMTKTEDTARHDVTLPPGKVIPIIFLPGVMGSNLRMSKKRQEELDMPDNRSWRPDDMMGASNQIDIVRGKGLGGWFKNASPRERQLIFDQNETEVEYYHYTESNGRFDPEGKETLAADARHKNVPDSLSAIPPLLGRNQSWNPAEVRKVHHETPAQIARWRGWSEVLFDGAYGQMLQRTEHLLNNIVKKGEISYVWQSRWNADGMPVYPVITDISLLWQGPKAFGGSGDVITQNELKKIAKCWYPVHAMGYNFLQSNGKSAQIIAERIRGMVKGYQHRGFKCDEVIIVTHSMGGLLARALIHPSYGNLLNDKNVKVLGIYHNVMPTLGAASAYKRMRFGFQEKVGYAAETAAEVLAIDGKHATAILANAPAPLEMMPGATYGPDWLKVVDSCNRVLMSWPKKKETALEHIYLQPEKAWWRLLNPMWVNPGDVPEKLGGGMKGVQYRIKDAAKFLQSIEKTFHPNTYASYCASPTRRSFGEIVFKIVAGTGSGIGDSGRPGLPSPETWTLISDDAKGKLIVQAGSQKLTLMLQPASAPGDETVPADRSAKHVAGTLFMHGEQSNGYEHQDSYSDKHVMASLLHSIVQIAKTAKWP